MTMFISWEPNVKGWVLYVVHEDGELEVIDYMGVVEDATTAWFRPN